MAIVPFTGCVPVRASPNRRRRGPISPVKSLTAAKVLMKRAT
ncbi:hypothetical protein ABT126_06780 [Streptomyces sp. NPDC002012]